MEKRGEKGRGARSCLFLSFSSLSLFSLSSLSPASTITAIQIMMGMGMMSCGWWEGDDGSRLARVASHQLPPTAAGAASDRHPPLRAPA